MIILNYSSKMRIIISKINKQIPVLIGNGYN